MERQGSPRFTVPGFHERAYWFDGNKNPMTMRRWWLHYFFQNLQQGFSLFRFYNQRFLCSYEMMMYPFDIQVEQIEKPQSTYFLIITEWASLSLSSKCLCPALSNNPLHGCQVWPLHLHDQSRAWVRLCWSTFYLCLNTLFRKCLMQSSELFLPSYVMSCFEKRQN